MVTDSPSDVEVRREDQDRINEFGRLNNRLLEIRADLTQYKSDAQTLDDAVSEVMLLTSDAPEDAPMLLIGESFVVSDEDSATNYCQKKLDEVQAKIETLNKEEAVILEKQGALKKELYGRFGDSINLEN